EAFARAGTERAPSAILRITGTFDGAVVYIDGRKSGVTPVLTRVSPGVHYVMATYPGDQVLGKRVMVGPDVTESVRLPFTRVAVEDRAWQLRRELLADGPVSPADAATAARRTAALTSTAIVVVIGSDAGGTPWVASFDTRDNRLGASISLAGQPDTEATDDLLRDLGLVRRIEPPVVLRPDPVPDPNPRDRSWWTSSRIKTGVAVGVILSVVGYSLLQLDTSPTPATVSGSSCCTIFQPGQ
ncbi:MAG: PEGA domain-containing protein, partial [Myxococcota bacterium]